MPEAVLTASPPGADRAARPTPLRIRRALARNWVALMLALSPLAAYAVDDCDNLNGIPETPGVLWDDVWEELDTRASCTQNCHGGSQPAAELDLSNRQISIYFLVGQPSAQDSFAPRVIPGNPSASLLFRKVNCQQPGIGSRMPLGDSHLPVDLQALIYDWIAQGALGEPAEDPIERSFIFIDSLESRQCRRSPDRVDSNCPRNGETWEGSDK